MATPILEDTDLFLLDDILWVIMTPVSQHQPFARNHYDFAFDRIFPCRHPWQRPNPIHAVARLGAFSSQYPTVFTELASRGISLIHTPEEHLRCTSLPVWYPILEDLTPRSLWFSGVPDVQRVAEELGWPIFMKGDRQTSRHQRRLSMIAGPEQFQQALDAYAQDSILNWQQIVCRRFVPLRLVEEWDAERLPASFEFRTFWWRGHLAGVGPYWWMARKYQADPTELAPGIALAQEAVHRLGMVFVVVDIAQTTTGEWLVIEVNDAQECGYTGIPPTKLWGEILALEHARTLP